MVLGLAGLLRGARLVRGDRVGGKGVLGVGDGLLEALGLGVQVARGEALVKVSGLLISAHLLEQGLALLVGVLGGSLACLVGQSGATLSIRT